jgi:hypothetical protein
MRLGSHYHLETPADQFVLKYHPRKVSSLSNKFLLKNAENPEDPEDRITEHGSACPKKAFCMLTRVLE